MKRKPGPRRGPRVPTNPAMTATEWGELIRRAYEVAQAAGPEPGAPPRKIRGSHAERLSGLIRRAYADGHSYGSLSRASGVCDRVLWRWAHYLRERRAEAAEAARKRAARDRAGSGQ